MTEPVDVLAIAERRANYWRKMMEGAWFGAQQKAWDAAWREYRLASEDVNIVHALASDLLRDAERAQERAWDAAYIIYRSGT